MSDIISDSVSPYWSWARVPSPVLVLVPSPVLVLVWIPSPVLYWSGFLVPCCTGILVPCCTGIPGPRAVLESLVPRAVLGTQSRAVTRKGFQSVLARTTEGIPEVPTECPGFPLPLRWKSLRCTVTDPPLPLRWRVLVVAALARTRAESRVRE